MRWTPVKFIQESYRPKIKGPMVTVRYTRRNMKGRKKALFPTLRIGLNRPALELLGSTDGKLYSLATGVDESGIHKFAVYESAIKPSQPIITLSAGGGYLNFGRIPALGQQVIGEIMLPVRKIKDGEIEFDLPEHFSNLV